MRYASQAAHLQVRVSQRRLASTLRGPGRAGTLQAHHGALSGTPQAHRSTPQAGTAARSAAWATAGRMLAPEVGEATDVVFEHKAVAVHRPHDDVGG